VFYVCYIVSLLAVLLCYFIRRVSIADLVTFTLYKSTPTILKTRKMGKLSQVMAISVPLRLKPIVLLVAYDSSVITGKATC